MKIISIFISFFLVSISSTGTIETNVYICKGKGSKRFHYTNNCRGLSKCSTKTYKVTLKKAKEIGRTLCGWED